MGPLHAGQATTFRRRGPAAFVCFDAGSVAPNTWKVFVLATWPCLLDNAGCRDNIKFCSATTPSGAAAPRETLAIFTPLSRYLSVRTCKANLPTRLTKRANMRLRNARRAVRRLVVRRFLELFSLLKYVCRATQARSKDRAGFETLQEERKKL